jgi:26S proteasome regulatory subunit N1
MAKDGERSAPADKGKGKVDDVKELTGGKNAQNDEKPTQADGKKKDEEQKEEGKPMAPSLSAQSSRLVCY